MKKLLAVIMILGLLAACASAGAASGKAFAFKPYPEFELKLDQEPYSLLYQFPSEAGMLAIASLATREEMRPYWTLYIAQQTGIVRQTGITDLADGTAVELSLDGDNVTDLIVTVRQGDSFFETKIEAASNPSCGPVFTLEVPEDAARSVSVPFQADLGYYQKMTIVLPEGTAPIEPEGPVTELPAAYSDETGSYAIDASGEAEYQKPAKDAANLSVPGAVTVNGVSVPVTKITDNAFKGNKKLTKIKLGANIKEIGKNAFANCAKLKTVSGGANLEVIGDSAFAGCKALKSITIGAKVTKIGKKAFSKCAALKKITIKSTLLTKNTVGSGAFKGINAKATVKVPKAVKKEYTKWLLKKGIKKTMKIK